MMGNYEEQARDRETSRVGHPGRQSHQGNEAAKRFAPDQGSRRCCMDATPPELRLGNRRVLCRTARLLTD